MRVIKVESSAISGVQHQGKELFVQFKGGKVYKYLNVNQSVFKALLKADSVGKFFNSKVRNSYFWKEYTPTNESAFGDFIGGLFR